MRKLGFLSFFWLLLFGWACTEETESPVIVSTEEAIFVGGDKIRVTGRLLTNREISASDHGFLISENEAFTAPVIISLGTKEGPGRFIGEASDLKISQNYWVKAFTTVDGENIEGQALQIQTLTPQIENYSPRFAKAGDELVISGRNLTETTRVFFGDKEATVLQNSFESRLTVRIPQNSGVPSVPLRLIIQDKELVFDQAFEYQSGKYTKLAAFPENFRIYNTVHFTNSSGFHVGLGEVRLGGVYSIFQRFNPQNETWSEVIFPGESRSYAFATANYLGGGALDRDFELVDRSFWKINGSSFTRLADLPFVSAEQVAVELNGFLYLLGGSNDGASQMIWRYSPGSNSWSQLADAPIEMSAQNPFFTYQDKIYVFNSLGALYEFQPNENRWTQKTVYPGSLGQGYGVAQVMGTKAYVGLYRRTQALYELDLNSFEWKIKNPIVGFAQSINSGHFEYNGSIYFLRAPEISVFGDLVLELYKFEPNAI